MIKNLRCEGICCRICCAVDSLYEIRYVKIRYVRRLRLT